jgi:pyruvate/2-oxoglutarate dehydrogenase complex dihydrolipoamide acyltransferase (E2) component
MSVNCYFVVLPHIGTNDDVATIVDWHVDDGKYVEEGDLICSVETTKAVSNIETENTGYIAQLVNKHDEVSISSPLALVSEDAADAVLQKKKYLLQKKGKNKDLESRITKKALKKAEELNVNVAKINIPGIIKTSDIENYAEVSKKLKPSVLQDSESLEELIELMGNQKTGKELMLESVNTIPQSYVEIELDVTILERKIEAYSKKQATIVTILSVIVCAAGKALKEYKAINGYRDSNQIKVSKTVNIGIVVSYNNAISIPVIKDASETTPDEVVKNLMRMRMDILRKKPKMEDLSGATFTISPMDHSKLIRFVPIVHPRQSAVLAIPAVQTKLEKNDDKQIFEKRYISLGMSFDHTFLDASIANDFLEEMVSQIEKISILFREHN